MIVSLRRVVSLVVGAAVLTFTARPAHAAVKIQAAYSETANIFDVMDNVSNWWPGFCEEEYQTYWNSKWPLTLKDKDLFEKYRSIRERHYKDPDQDEKDPLKNRNGLFATLGAITADPVAEAFYSADTLDGAFKALTAIVKPDELEFLRGFYSAFADRYKVLMAESAPFKEVAVHITSALKKPGIDAYFAKVARFFRVNTDIDYRVLYVWWPPINRTNASPIGTFLLMRYNPIKHLEDAKLDSDIVFHEVVHTISARQDLAQKQALTREFVATCDTKGKIKRMNLLEEPLAVAFGQALFLQQFDPSRYQYGTNWYAEKWTNMFAKLIYPTVKEEFDTGRTITDGLVQKAGKHCKEVLAVVEKFAPQ